MDCRDYDYSAKRDGFDPKAMTFTITAPDWEEEVSHTFPAKYEVCPTCEGQGKHVNPNIDRNGLTREDFDEDPDFEEAYFAGRFDVPCVECKGQRVVGAVDVDALTTAQRAIYEAWQERVAEDFAEQRWEAQTRRMENGGWDY